MVFHKFIWEFMFYLKLNHSFLKLVSSSKRVLWMGGTPVVACLSYLCFFLYFIVSFFCSHSFTPLLDKAGNKLFQKGPKGSRRTLNFSTLRRGYGQILRWAAALFLLLSTIKIKRKNINLIFTISNYHSTLNEYILSSYILGWKNILRGDLGKKGLSRF